MDFQYYPVQKIQNFYRKDLICALSFLLILFSFLLFLDYFDHFQPQSLFQTYFFSQILQNDKNLTLRTCDNSKGTWVLDESNQIESYNENCPFLDPGFRCHQNGRKDNDYLKWRWQPDNCDIPRWGDW